MDRRVRTFAEDISGNKRKQRSFRRGQAPPHDQLVDIDTGTLSSANHLGSNGAAMAMRICMPLPAGRPSVPGSYSSRETAMVPVQPLSPNSQSPSLGEGERRHVTVMFTDVVGFTSLTERLGEEGVFSLMRRLAGEQSATIDHYGGVLQDFAGDGLMAVFGAPVAIEDAPLRACRAALEISAAFRLFRANCRASLGVHLSCVSAYMPDQPF
jgi:hypothetical protein